MDGPPPRVPREVRLAEAKVLLTTARRIVAFSGAGLSAESGVPTFRDAATGGQWLRYDPTQLASPEGFRRDPDLVIEWYNDRRRNLAGVAPNPAHEALATRPEILNVTQNVDDLLERAGVTDAIHLHGTIHHDRCDAACGHEETVDLSNPPPRRTCPRCGAAMRPAVVWFGESLPADAWTAAEAAVLACDLLLVLGTAAEVHPAASLIDRAASSDARVIIVNTNASVASRLADVEVLGPVGTVLPALL